MIVRLMVISLGPDQKLYRPWTYTLDVYVEEGLRFVLHYSWNGKRHVKKG